MGISHKIKEKGLWQDFVRGVLTFWLPQMLPHVALTYQMLTCNSGSFGSDRGGRSSNSGFSRFGGGGGGSGSGRSGGGYGGGSSFGRSDDGYGGSSFGGSSRPGGEAQTVHLVSAPTILIVAVAPGDSVQVKVLSVALVLVGSVIEILSGKHYINNFLTCCWK